MTDNTPTSEVKYDPELRRSHVIILGAGASKAAFPGGDAKGNIVPVMNELVEVANLKRFLDYRGIKELPNNFEELYSELLNRGDQEILKIIEFAVWQYFVCMEMPIKPTLYDHLILSLRDKDMIATFNWDPFLIEARLRNRKVKSLPQLAFLHGNVRIGYCKEHNEYGIMASRCPICDEYIKPTALLYPVLEKDYDFNKFIKTQWDMLGAYLESACTLTIFGYSGPASDTKAVELMKKAWGEVQKRNLEQIEIIDIKSDQELYETWKPFIYPGHYEVRKSLYESYIGRFPRRSAEAFWAQFMDARFIDGIEYPKDASWENLRKFYSPLLEEENTDIEES